MKFRASAALIDIEGTVGSIAFVRDVLFPYASARLDAYVAEHEGDPKVREILELRKYFSHRFDLLMSAKLAELGYELETELKPGKRGGMEYKTWDIKAAPGHEKGWNSINAKNSQFSNELAAYNAENAVSSSQSSGIGSLVGGLGTQFAHELQQLI